MTADECLVALQPRRDALALGRRAPDPGGRRARPDHDGPAAVAFEAALLRLAQVDRHHRVPGRGAAPRLAGTGPAAPVPGCDASCAGAGGARGPRVALRPDA